jgi:hypothetical protein
MIKVNILNMIKTNYYLIIIMTLIISLYIFFNTKSSTKVEYDFNIPFNNNIEHFGEGLTDTILDLFKSSDNLETDLDDMLKEDANTNVTNSDKLPIKHPYLGDTSSSVTNSDTTAPYLEINPNTNSVIIKSSKNDVLDSSNLVSKPNDVQLNNGKPLSSIPTNTDKSDAHMNLLKNTCKFFDSQKCNNDYPTYTGASLGIEGSNMVCDSSDSLSEDASLIAEINNNQVTNVHVIKSGLGYSSVPILKVIGGNGNGAKLFPVLNKKGGIDRVVIKNPGNNYTNTPTIKILQGKGGSKCFLCCK